MRALALRATMCTFLVCACRQSPPAVIEMRVGRADIPGYALFYVADDLDLWSKYGVRVISTPFVSGREAFQATLRGEFDVATAYVVPILFQTFAGADISIVSTAYRGGLHSGVLVHPSNDIRRAPDLRGRRVGATPQTSSAFFLDVLLAEAGVDPREVEIQSAPQPELVRMLQEGTIDAASLWAPFLQAAAKHLPGKPGMLTTDAYTDLSVLAGRRDRVQQKRDGIMRMLRALKDAQERIARNPDLALAATAPRFPEIPEADLRQLIQQTRFELGMSNLLLTMLRQEAAWIEREDASRGHDIRLRAMLEPDLLEAVAPEAVTLLSAHSPPGSDLP